MLEAQLRDHANVVLESWSSYAGRTASKRTAKQGSTLMVAFQIIQAHPNIQ